MVRVGNVFQEPNGLFYTVAQINGEDCMCYALIAEAKVVKEFKTEDIERWKLDIYATQSEKDNLPPGEYTITISRYQTQRVKVIVNEPMTLDNLISQEEEAAPTHDDSFDPETTEYEVVSITGPSGDYLWD